MSTSGSRGFVTELLKDIIYPEVCPICGDIITVDRRTAYHKVRGNRKDKLNHRFRAAGSMRSDAAAAAAMRHDIASVYADTNELRCKISRDTYSQYKGSQYRDLQDKDSRNMLSAYYGGLVCDSCLANLDFIAQPYCSKCGKPLNSNAMIYSASADNIVADNTSVPFDTVYHHMEDTSPVASGTAYSASLRSTAVPTGTCSGVASPALLCTDCRTHARSFIQCRALLSYDERMRDIMADIKYNGKREYLKLFGLLAADKLGAWIAGNNINCLIPVPIHASRLLKRGYNQSELLCEYISELTHIPVRWDIIIREKKTAAQKELNVDERLLNLQNAFKPAGKLPHGSRALIVDDIYTTGSTMEACTECLRTAGAEAVYGLAVCIGEDKEAKDTTEGTNHGIQKRH